MPSPDDDQYVAIRRSELLTVIRHLETLVVSMARIGTCGKDEQDEIFLRFCDDWNLCRRLAECRSILSSYFPRELGPDDMDELERELQNNPYWSFSNRQVPRE